jgi:hypothetical protein
VPISVPVVVGLGRAASGTVVIAILLFAYVLRIAVGDGNPFDYFGYFTNLTALLSSLVLIGTGSRMLSGLPVGSLLILLRGVATASLLVVAVIYNTVVPGTGSAPPWVNFVLHVAFPLLVALDWVLIGDRSRLPWRRLWMFLPYPALWLTVVLTRGATEGWVPYGFLLPERGPLSLIVTIVGLLVALLAAGALVWFASGFRGRYLAVTEPASRPA